MHSAPPNAAADTRSLTRPPLLPSQKAQLRARTMCAEKTIDRWWRGDRVQPVNEERLSNAAAELGITPPSGGVAA